MISDIDLRDTEDNNNAALPVAHDKPLDSIAAEIMETEAEIESLMQKLDDFSFIDASDQVYATPPMVEQKLAERDRDPDVPEGQISLSTSVAGKQPLPDDIAAEDLAKQLVLLQQNFQHKTRAGSQITPPTQAIRCLVRHHQECLDQTKHPDGGVSDTANKEKSPSSERLSEVLPGQEVLASFYSAEHPELVRVDTTTGPSMWGIVPASCLDPLLPERPKWFLEDNRDPKVSNSSIKALPKSFVTRWNKLTRSRPRSAKLDLVRAMQKSLAAIICACNDQDLQNGETSPSKVRSKRSPALPKPRKASVTHSPGDSGGDHTSMLHVLSQVERELAGKSSRGTVTQRMDQIDKRLGLPTHPGVPQGSLQQRLLDAWTHVFGPRVPYPGHILDAQTGVCVLGVTGANAEDCNGTYQQASVMYNDKPLFRKSSGSQRMCLRFVDGAWEIAAEASKQPDEKSPAVCRSEGVTVSHPILVSRWRVREGEQWEEQSEVKVFNLSSQRQILVYDAQSGEFSPLNSFWFGNDPDPRASPSRLRPLPDALVRTEDAAATVVTALKAAEDADADNGDLKTAVNTIIGKRGMVAMVSVNGNSTEMQLRLKWNSGRRCALLTVATTPEPQQIPIGKDTSISVESGVLNVQTPMESVDQSAHVSVRFVDSANLAKWLSKLEDVKVVSQTSHAHDDTSPRSRARLPTSAIALSRDVRELVGNIEADVLASDAAGDGVTLGRKSVEGQERFPSPRYTTLSTSHDDTENQKSSEAMMTNVINEHVEREENVRRRSQRKSTVADLRAWLQLMYNKFKSEMRKKASLPGSSDINTSIAKGSPETTGNSKAAKDASSALPSPPLSPVLPLLPINQLYAKLEDLGVEQLSDLDLMTLDDWLQTDVPEDIAHAFMDAPKHFPVDMSLEEIPRDILALPNGDSDQSKPRVKMVDKAISPIKQDTIRIRNSLRLRVSMVRDAAVTEDTHSTIEDFSSTRQELPSPRHPEETEPALTPSPTSPYTTDNVDTNANEPGVQTNAKDKDKAVSKEKCLYFSLYEQERLRTTTQLEEIRRLNQRHQSDEKEIRRLQRELASAKAIITKMAIDTEVEGSEPGFALASVDNSTDFPSKPNTPRGSSTSSGLTTVSRAVARKWLDAQRSLEVEDSSQASEDVMAQLLARMWTQEVQELKGMPMAPLERRIRQLSPSQSPEEATQKDNRKAEKAQPAMQSTQDHRNHLRAMLQWQSGYCNALGHAVEFQKQQYKLTETLHHFDDTVHMLGARYLRLLDACNIPGLLGIALREMQRLENAWNHLQDSESGTNATEVLSRACSEFALDLPRIREAMLPFCNCCGAVEGVLGRALAALLAMRVQMTNQRKRFLSALQHLKHTLNLPLEFIANLRHNWELLLLPLKQHGSGSQLKSVLGDVLAISRTCLEKAYQSKLDVLRIDVPELERLLILAANDASSIGKAPRFIHTGFFRRASSKAEGVKGLAVTLWLFPGVLIETSFTASKSRSKLGKGVIITRMRKHFVPPGVSALKWTRYCKGSVSQMYKAIRSGSVKLPTEGVYVKSAQQSKQHGRDIYFKIAKHPRGASLYFNLFEEEPKDLEHAVKMHSDLSRVTTRVFLLRHSTAGKTSSNPTNTNTNADTDQRGSAIRPLCYFGLAYHKPHKPLLLHSEMQSEESSHVLLEAQTQIQSPRGSPGGTGMSKWCTEHSKSMSARWMGLLRGNRARIQ